MEQAFLDAYAEKGAQTFFYKNSRATSGSYTYVVGAMRNTGTGYDWKVLKLDAAQELSWSTYIAGAPYLLTPEYCDLDLRTEGATTNVYLVGTASGAGLTNFDSQTFGNWNISPVLYSQWFSVAFICWWESENAEHTLKWASLLHPGDASTSISVTADPVTGYIIVGGSTYTETLQEAQNYCTQPLSYEFPLCNAGGLNYMETTNPNSGDRSFLMVFDQQVNPRWISFFGDDTYARIVNLAVGGDYIYACGESENPWTLWEYDAESELDYYKNTFSSGNGMDAALARFAISTTVGIEEQLTGNAINLAIVYPNPSQGLLNVELLKRASELNISVYDATGKLIFSHRQTNPSNLLQLDTSTWSQGLYQLQVVVDGVSQSIPVVKQ